MTVSSLDLESVDRFREASRSLITTVALITSTGKHGANAMSAEWTFQISYRPMKLAVLVHPRDATYDNMVETREFGANFLSDDQAPHASLAGYYTGKDTRKLSSELFQTYPGQQIHAPMVSGCFVNAECLVEQILETGDHTMIIGRVVEVKFDDSKSPLLYSRRKYWKRGAVIEKIPFIYVTCTVRSELVRVQGRLQGVETYPQTVMISVRGDDKNPILEERVVTDDRGYFDVERTVRTDPDGRKILATASWKNLTGKALSKE